VLPLFLFKGVDAISISPCFTIDLGVDGGKDRNVWLITGWDYLYNSD